MLINKKATKEGKFLFNKRARYLKIQGIMLEWRKKEFGKQIKWWGNTKISRTFYCIYELKRIQNKSKNLSLI